MYNFILKNKIAADGKADEFIGDDYFLFSYSLISNSWLLRFSVKSILQTEHGGNNAVKNDKHKQGDKG